jgi:hypothetical protein
VEIKRADIRATTIRANSPNSGLNQRALRHWSIVSAIFKVTAMVTALPVFSCVTSVDYTPVTDAAARPGENFSRLRAPDPAAGEDRNLPPNHGAMTGMVRTALLVVVSWCRLWP